MIFKKTLTKKALALSLLALLISGQGNTKCLQIDMKPLVYAPIILGATTVVTTCSTLYLWYKNRQKSKEIEFLRSEVQQKENDQKLLVEIGQYIDSVNQKFEDEILLAKSKPNLYQEEYIERWIDISKRKRSIVQFINMAHSEISAYKKNLEIRISEWNRVNSQEAYTVKGKELIKELVSLEALFSDMSQSVKSQLSFIELSLIMDRDIFGEYSAELTVAKQFTGQKLVNELDKLIRSKVEAHNQFPYLSYASKLKGNIDNIKRVLEKLKGVKLYVFQERVIEQANELLSSLSSLLESIVSISSYQQEQVRKPEFENQQKLLAADLKEREERILREKQVVETRLLNEKNREQSLANERARIERERQALIVQERNINYEREKIISGQWLKEELTKESTKNENKLKTEIEKVKSETAKQLSAKEQELASLRYSLQNLDYQKRQTDQSLNQVYSNIAVCKQYIKNLQDKLKTPPCNPEAVDGLKDYLATLNNLSRAAIESV